MEIVSEPNPTAEVGERDNWPANTSLQTDERRTSVAAYRKVTLAPLASMMTPLAPALSNTALAAGGLPMPRLCNTAHRPIRGQRGGDHEVAVVGEQREKLWALRRVPCSPEGTKCGHSCETQAGRKTSFAGALRPSLVT